MVNIPYTWMPWDGILVDQDSLENLLPLEKSLA